MQHSGRLRQHRPESSSERRLLPLRLDRCSERFRWLAAAVGLEATSSTSANIKADATNETIVFILVAKRDGLEGSKGRQGHSSGLLIWLLRTGGKTEAEDQTQEVAMTLLFLLEEAVKFSTLSPKMR